MGLDGAKYALFAKNCEIDRGECARDKPKTQLCLKIINTKDYCSKNSMDFVFDSDFYPIMGKNLRIAWINDKLSMSSSQASDEFQHKLFKQKMLEK